MWLALQLLGCNLTAIEVERNCLHRVAYYPDADGDGFGEPTEVFLGCEPPPGWVALLDADPTDSAAGTGDTAAPTDTGPAPTETAAPTDTAPPADTATPTGDTGAPTGTAPTDTAGATDTGPPADTAAPPTDTGDGTTPLDTAAGGSGAGP